jgi:hypothetical protein
MTISQKTACELFFRYAEFLVKVGEDEEGLETAPTDREEKLREPVMGIEPMTAVLPRLCATAAPHGPGES